MIDEETIDFRGKLELIISLKDSVVKLPDKQKAIIALLSAGYSQNSSSGILGLTRVAIGIQYKKALTKLREELL